MYDLGLWQGTKPRILMQDSHTNPYQTILMGKLSRNKGASWEREVSNRFTAVTGEPFKRNLTETREGNAGDVVSALPIAIQCKVGARPPVWDALKEAQDVAMEGDLAVAVCKKNGSRHNPPEEIVAMSLADFELYVLPHLSREFRNGRRKAG